MQKFQVPSTTYPLHEYRHILCDSVTTKSIREISSGYEIFVCKKSILSDIFAFERYQAGQVDLTKITKVEVEENEKGYLKQKRQLTTLF